MTYVKYNSILGDNVCSYEHSNTSSVYHNGGLIMSLLTNLRKNRYISWTLLICFTFSHIPFVSPMAVQGLAPQVQAYLAALLGMRANQGSDSRYDAQQLLNEAGLSYLHEDLALAMATGDMQQVRTLCASYEEKLTHDSKPIDIAAFTLHMQNLSKQVPTHTAIYNIINSAAQRRWPAVEQDNPPRVHVPPYEHIHEQSIPSGATVSPSLPTQKPQPWQPQFALPTFRPPVNPDTVVPDEPQGSENQLPCSTYQPPFNPKNIPPSGLTQTFAAITAAGVLLYELALGIYKAATTVKEQKHADEETDKALESNPFLHAAHRKAVDDAITIALKAHSPFSTSNERNHALLAMNYINIVGKTGRYITNLIQTLNPHYFNKDGSLKQTRTKIDYERSVDRFIPLFKNIAKSTEEYHQYLTDLKYAFNLDAPEARKKFPKVYRKIQHALKSEFTPHQESDFLNILYELLPKDAKTYGTIHPSIIKENPHNKAFISLINRCTFDVTDPHADPLNQVQDAKKFYEEYGKHQTTEEKLSFVASNTTYIKQYQQMMRNFFQDMFSSTFDSRNIPFAFEHDPYISHFSTDNIKEHIRQLALRYHMKKNVQAQLGLEGFDKKEIEQLLYAFITPATTNNYTELPSHKTIIDHLVDGSSARKNALKETLFNQFFTEQGILKSLQDKAQQYPELARLNGLTQKNKDIIRYANYFLALDSTPEAKKHIEQGIQYLTAASQDAQATPDYLKLAQAQYTALTNPKGCLDFLQCGNLAQLHKYPYQNIVQNFIRNLAVEGLTLQEANSPHISPEEQRKKEALSRYALKTAHIAHMLNAQGKSEDAKTMAINVLELLRNPHHKTSSFQVLVDIINKVSDMPGAFEPASLICTALRRDLDECKPDLVKKAHTQAQKLEETLQAENTKLKPGTQKALHEQLKAATTQAKNVLDQATRYPSPQSTSAAIHADLLRRLSQEAYTLNSDGHSQEALKLFNDFAPGLINECEAYDKNKQDKPKDTHPPRAPQAASPKGTCQAELPKEPTASCGTGTHQGSRERTPCGTGIQEQKEPESRTCNAGQQAAPSFDGPTVQEIVGKAIEKALEIIDEEKNASKEPAPQQPQNESKLPTQAHSSEQDSTPEKESKQEHDVPSKVIPAILPPSITSPTLATAPATVTPTAPAGSQTAAISPISAGPSASVQPLSLPASSTGQQQLTAQDWCNTRKQKFLKEIQDKGILLEKDPYITQEKFEKVLEWACTLFKDTDTIYLRLEQLKKINRYLNEEAKAILPIIPGYTDKPIELIFDIYHIFLPEIIYKESTGNVAQIKGLHADCGGEIEQLGNSGEPCRIQVKHTGKEALNCRKLIFTLNGVKSGEKDAFSQYYTWFECMQTALKALKNIHKHVTDKIKDGQLVIYGSTENHVVIKFVIRRRKVQTFHPDIDRTIELITTGKLERK